MEADRQTHNNKTEKTRKKAKKETGKILVKPLVVRGAEVGMVQKAEKNE